MCKHIIKIKSSQPAIHVLNSVKHHPFPVSIVNPDKCSFMLFGADDELQTKLVCGNETLKNSKQEKVLGVTIDNKLNFATHLSNITKNSNIKFNALTRVQNYMTIDKRKQTYILLLNLSSLTAL